VGSNPTFGTSIREATWSWSMTTGTATPPTSEQQPSPASRAQVIGRAVLLVGVLAIVFFVVLPRAVDFNAVRAALAALSLGQAAALVAATVVAYVLNAAPCRILIPQLTWPRAVAADLSARAVASTIPGPSDVATRLLLYRQWGIPTDVANAGTMLAAFFETTSSLALPIVALPAVLITGDTARPTIIWVTLIGLLVLGIAGFGLGSMVRSVSVARRFGQWLDRAARRISGWLRRPAPSGLVDQVVDLRARTAGVLTANGRRGFLGAVAAKLAWFVVLEVSLLSVGIGWQILSPAAVLAAMAIVSIVSLLPITPGAVGVAELAYVGVLSAAAGEAYTDPITAAVLLFRIAQWLVPIPVGWLVFAAIRQRHLAELVRGPGGARRP
jgi:putative heme transporter